MSALDRARYAPMVALLAVVAQDSGKPMFVLGVTHWRCINDRISAEITVFDDLAVLSQTMLD